MAGVVEVVCCLLLLAAAGRDLLEQYGCGPIRFSGHQDALYERHLLFDDVIDPVDAGPLRVARYTEPFTLLIAQLAYEGKGGPRLAYRLERFGH